MQSKMVLVDLALISSGVVFRMAKGWVSYLVSQLLPSCLSCVPSLGEYGVPFENYLTCYITGLQ